MSNIHDWFFFALGVGFALITAVHAYQRGDVSGVAAAERRRNKQAKKVQELHTMLSGLCAGYAQTYETLRNMGLETSSEAKGLCELYRQTAQHHSIFDFEPEIPELRLPRELEPEDPPPPPLPSKNFQETHQ